MLDVKTIIKDYIYDNWDKTNFSPELAKTDVVWKMGLEEFNMNSTDPQINISEEVEPRETKTFIVTGIYRVEQNVKISIFKKPVDYSVSKVTACETVIRSIKTEIDRILNVGRYDIPSLNRVGLSGWENRTSSEEEPILYITEQIVNCLYYIT